MKSPNSWDSTYDLYIALDYSAGHSVRAIADKLGFSYQFVLHRIYEYRTPRSNYDQRRITNDIIASNIDRIVLPKKPKFNYHYRFSNTSLEVSVKSYLVNKGEVVESAKRIGRFMHEYDLFLPKKNTLIEVDGSWCHRTDRELHRDRIVNYVARKLGFNLIRLKESELSDLESNLIIRDLEYPSDSEINLIDDYIKRDKMFYAKDIIHSRIPIYPRRDSSNENHWKWRPDINLDDIISFCNSGTYKVNDIYRKFKITRNCLVKRLSQACVEYDYFVARYLYKKGPERQGTTKWRIKLADQGIRPDFPITTKLMKEHPLPGGVRYFSNLTGYSRNFILLCYWISGL